MNFTCIDVDEYFFIYFQWMANGVHGERMEVVIKNVVEAYKNDFDHVQIQHQDTVAKIVLEALNLSEFATHTTVQVPTWQKMSLTFTTHYEMLCLTSFTVSDT